MLDLNPDIVCHIINLAHEFHAKEEVVLPEEPFSPSDDWAMQILAAHAGDSTYAELSTAIADLEPDQQASLVALMWVGRGDFEVSEWQEALDEATREATARTAEYLLATPLVADYLAEGLNQMGYSCDEA